MAPQRKRCILLVCTSVGVRCSGHADGLCHPVDRRRIQDNLTTCWRAFPWKGRETSYGPRHWSHARCSEFAEGYLRVKLNFSLGYHTLTFDIVTSSKSRHARRVVRKNVNWGISLSTTCQYIETPFLLFTWQMTLEQIPLRCSHCIRQLSHRNARGARSSRSDIPRMAAWTSGNHQNSGEKVIRLSTRFEADPRSFDIHYQRCQTEPSLRVYCCR